MAPPKGSAQKAQQKAARRELQQKKAAAKKQKKRQKQGQLDYDEVPIDILLQRLEEEQRQRQINKTQALPCSQPSPRAHASLTLLPSEAFGVKIVPGWRLFSPSGDLLLFGGESYDGKKVRVYGDLFKWDFDKSEWRRLEAPEVPKARCSHQAVYHNDALYVFGGEFSTYYQFHHFKDFWRFDVKTNLWNKILVECPTQVPSPRSGHRMVVWRGFLILFGGFHDTGRDTRYYNDLFIFSFSENKWRKIEFPPHTHIPEPRGGFVFAGVGDVVLLHGGFAKVRDTHKRVQGKTFTDTWLLDLKPLAKGAFNQSPVWEKIKNSGTPPSPRTGMCATAYKSSVLVFGGVADKDDGGTNLSSTFFNDLYSFDISKRRWYLLELKSGKKKPEKKQHVEQCEQSAGEDQLICEPESEEGESSSGEDDNWQTTFAYFDTKGRLVKVRLEDLTNMQCGESDNSTPATQHELRPGDEVLHHEQGSNGNTDVCNNTASPPPSCVAQKVTESTEATDGGRAQEGRGGSAASVPPELVAPGRQAPRMFSADTPLPRLHGMLLVRGSNLVLMGGIMELGSKEVTLDDCWTLNLNKRDRWVRVLEGTMHEQQWQGAESGAESSGGSSSDADSSDSGSEGSDSELEDDISSDSDEEDSRSLAKGRRCYRVREEMQQLRDKFGLDDPMETPAEGETLRNFFERTKPYWIQKASVAAASGSGGKHSKEITRAAFEAASARVSSISDALRRVDELLRKQQSKAENDGSAKNTGQGGAASRKRR